MGMGALQETMKTFWNFILGMVAQLWKYTKSIVHFKILWYVSYLNKSYKKQNFSTALLHCKKCKGENAFCYLLLG